MMNMNLPISNVEEEELNWIRFIIPCPRLGLRMSTSCSKEVSSCCLLAGCILQVASCPGSFRWKEDAKQVLAKLKAMKKSFGSSP